LRVFFPGRTSIVASLAALGALVAPASAAGEGAVRTVTLPTPAETIVNEPKVAFAPDRPRHLVVLAQATAAEGPRQILWRSGDGGAGWTRPRLMGGTGNGAEGFAADTALAAGRGGPVVVGGLIADVDASGALTIHAGTRVSDDGGATFPGFASADAAANLCGQVPPPCEGIDKPALAMDRSRGRFAGRVYLVWIHERTPPELFATTLRLAVSTDGGRTYGPSTVLDRRVFRSAETDPEWNAQVAVRPDGTVDVIWNTVRAGRPWIVHAASHDGGASFSAPRRIVALDPDASVLGIVSTLAISPSGRRAVCWSQSVSADGNDQRVRCIASRRAGTWSAPRAFPAGPGARVYLPAAAFQGRRLAVAAYMSTARGTRLVLAEAARAGGRFGSVRALRRWDLPASAICGYTPAECGPDQTNIGDSISAVATRRRLTVAYVAPALPQTENRVLVSTVTAR
jgi:hypothetical protein